MQSKIKILEFFGEESEFADWLKKVQNIFSSYYAIDEKKAKLVETSLKGSVADWWQQLKFVRKE